MRFVLFLVFSFTSIFTFASEKMKESAPMTFPTKQISVSINRSAADVYHFAGNPENLPKWAEGLSKSKMSKVDGEWIADSPMGKVKVRFAKDNNFGVLDHDVVLPSGEVNHNPLRVVKNNNGSEVIFTLFHLPRMSDTEFNHDAELVEKDLKRLKAVLEK